MLDEPVASLDPERADGIRRLIERIRDELALPILLVSHDRVEVERLAGRVVTMELTRPQYHACAKMALSIGSERTRLPVSLNNALVSAGITGGKAGSPRPEGSLHPT